MTSRLLAAVALLGALLGAPARADDEEADLARALAQAREVEAELVGAVRRVEGAAVTVVGRRVRQQHRSGETSRPLPLSGVGSGVAIRWRGTWVITNEHVVHGEPYVEAITADGRRHRLRVRATSRGLDLALLAFDDEPEGLQAVDLEKQGAADMREGTWVLATGNPFFLSLDGVPVATLGVVSGMRPPDPEAYLDATTIQHDAEINPGSSGGALWSLAGELLGINGTIATRISRDGGGPAHTGASFAVPVAAVRQFLRATVPPPPVVGERAGPTPSPPALRASRSPNALGVRFRTGRDAQGRPAGAVVGEIVGTRPGEPPRVTRLRAGDLVTRLTTGNTTYVVRSADDVNRLLGRQRPGTTIRLLFQRRGRTYTWTGRLGP